MRSNISYTNKDFNSIYTELLQYVRSLSSDWDPVESNESDPGLILLKLAAIIGDKDSYNIDKNILELMPASVTQLPAARQIFEQCGYSMRYYRSAEGILNLTAVKHPGVAGTDYQEQTNYTYTVPQFTMFTDDSNSVVYTAIEPTVLSYKVETPITVREGVVTTYTVNNDPLITLANLDNNNRLYFTEKDIAENGIFITNVDSKKVNFKNYTEWKQVSNLETQPAKTRCYKFGITLDESICYLEFPDDIELLFGEGINITYLRTTGKNGNAAFQQIDRFYNVSTLPRTTVETNTTVDVEVNRVVSEGNTAERNIVIKNIFPITGGADPETIEEAYKSYQRVKGTFDTLVSLTDYTDYMVTSKAASNGYVCDRTNDIEYAYKIVTTGLDGKVSHHVVEPVSEDKQLYIRNENGEYESVETPVMNAFDLCIYALEYVPTVSTQPTYKASFTLTDGKKYKEILDNDAFDVKSMQHNYVDFSDNRILMLKNKYAIHANIVPSYTLTETEKYQVKFNVETALYEALNSKQIQFGEQVSIDTIQSVILSADERIKSLIDFVSPKYETYAVYKTGDVFKEIRIDHESIDGGYVVKNIATKAMFKTLRDKNLLYVRDNVLTPPRRVMSSELFDYTQTYYIWDQDSHDLWQSFRAEIYAKNVLAGVTPLYNADETYTFGVNQSNMYEIENITQITTNTDIKFKSTNEENTYVSDVLKENEGILFTAPNFVQENSYSSYVKIIYQFNSDVQSDTYHELKNNEFIVFMWQAASTDSTYTYIKYDNSDLSLAKVIKLQGIMLPAVQPDITDSARSYFASLPSGVRQLLNDKTTVDKLGNVTPNAFVKSLVKESNYEVLTGVKSVYTYNVNEIHINNKTDGCGYLYWILNRTNNFGNYQLFDEQSTEYTLASGEYFIYTNDEKSVIHLLGEGTKINRSKNWINTNPIWSVKPITYEELLLEGVTILADKWFNVGRVPKCRIESEADDCVWATEMQQILIGPGSSVMIRSNNDTIDWKNLVLSNKEQPITDCIVSYTDTAGNISDISAIQASDITWYAKTLLNVNLSSTQPQVVYDNQTFTFKCVGEEDEVSILEVSGKDGVQYLLCNTTLSLIGGIDIPVRFFGAYEDTVSLLTYTQQEQQSGVSYNENKFTCVITDHIETEKQIRIPEFTLLEGKYLFQINGSDNLTALDVKDPQSSEFSITPLIDPNNSTKTNTRIYSLVVTPNQGTVATITLNLECTANNADVSIYVAPLFKYNTDNLNQILSGEESFETSVLAKLASLDKQQRFNYTNIPTNSINNPLIADEFFKTLHVYNPYTIAEWDTVDHITTHDVIN